MDYDLYKSLVALPSIDRVCLGQYGEPTLWPHLLRAIALAKKHDHYVWTTSNGQLVTEKMATGFLDTGLDKIIFSIDAIDRETYEHLRPGLSWDTVIDNVTRLYEMREHYGYDLRVVVNVVRTAELKATDKEVRAFWDGHVDGVAITPEVDVSPLHGVCSEKPISCERVTDHLTIRWDGEMMMCCRDCHGEMLFGDVSEDDPLRLYNSDEFNALRHALETGQDYPEICRGCRAFWPDRRDPVRG
jgi:radical SAM protein with 4Fe4S-binding SPASM domain